MNEVLLLWPGMSRIVMGNPSLFDSYQASDPNIQLRSRRK